MSLNWEPVGLNWVSGPYECRLIPAPKGAKPGTRHRWQAYYKGEPLARPSCMIECRKAVRAHFGAQAEQMQ